MFSEALRIMDRNTTKYMIDELHDQLNAARQEKNEMSQVLSVKLWTNWICIAGLKDHIQITDQSTSCRGSTAQL